MIMGFFNYKHAREIYENDRFMAQIIDGLEDMDQFHLLRDAGDLRNIFGNIPDSAAEYKRWLTVCNGGLLFSTTLLSTNEYDQELDLSFSTLQEWNASRKNEFLGLPEEYFIIALLNYGDPVCLSSSDSRIYLWDTTEMTFTTVWESFADFLADEYNTAVQMVEDNALDFVPIKTEERNGE